MSSQKGPIAGESVSVERFSLLHSEREASGVAPGKVKVVVSPRDVGLERGVFPKGRGRNFGDSGALESRFRQEDDEGLLAYSFSSSGVPR